MIYQTAHIFVARLSPVGTKRSSLSAAEFSPRERYEFPGVLVYMYIIYSRAYVPRLRMSSILDMVPVFSGQDHHRRNSHGQNYGFHSRVEMRLSPQHAYWIYSRGVSSAAAGFREKFSRDARNSVTDDCGSSC